jgi:hypothetical protein
MAESFKPLSQVALPFPFDVTENSGLRVRAGAVLVGSSFILNTTTFPLPHTPGI